MQINQRVVIRNVLFLFDQIVFDIFEAFEIWIESHQSFIE